jgi:hypothetical protein
MRHAAVAGPACNANDPAAGPSSINREREGAAAVTNCNQQWAGARATHHQDSGQVGRSITGARPLFLLLSSPAGGGGGGGGGEGEQVAGEPLGGSGVREGEAERSAGEKGAGTQSCHAVQRRGGVGG